MKGWRPLDRLHPAVVAVGFFAGLCVICLPLANRCYSNGLVDIGEYLNNAVRLLEGQLPYRDFWLFHPPGEVFLPASQYRLAGVQINHILAVNVLINVLTGACSFILARRLLHNNTFALWTALVVFFNGVPTGPGMAVASQSNQYFLGLVIAFILFVQAVETDRPVWLWWSGVAVGCASVFRFFDAAPAVLALLTGIGIQWGPRDAVKRMGVFAAGGAAVWVAVSAVLRPVWWPMMRAITVEALRHHVRFFHGARLWWPLADGGRAVLEQLRLLRRVGGFTENAKLLFRLFSLLNSVVLYLLPLFVGAIGGHAVLRKRIEKSERAITAAFLIWGLLALGKAFKYPAIYYWAAGTTPLLFVLGLMARWAPGQGVQRWRAPLAGIALALTLSIPSGVAIAAMRLATVHERIDGPGGFLMVEDAGYAQEVRSVIALILQRSWPGDYVFIDAYHIPPLYAMTGRKNATRYDSLQDLFATQLAGLPTEAEEAQICHELLSKETTVIVTEQRKRSNQYHVLQRCITSHFVLAGQCGGYDIYASPR